MAVTVDRFEALMSVRRFADAETCARDLIAQYPDWGGGYTHLARTLIEQKRYDEALPAAKEGVRKAPQDAWAHGTLGLVFERLNRFEDAIVAAHEALRLLPTYSFAWCGLSYNYDCLQKYRQALEATTTGLKHHPHDQELLRYHAFNLYRSNRFDEAERVARECLRLHPTSHEALHVLGVVTMARAERAVFRRVRLHRLAHGFFLQALRLQPTLEHIHMNARDNAVSCRRFVWISLIWVPYLVLAEVLIYMAMSWLTGDWRLVGNPMKIVPLVAFGLGGVFAFSFSPAEERTYFLSLPLERWGVPTVPPAQQSVVRSWGTYWPIVFCFPLVACACGALLAAYLK